MPSRSYSSSGRRIQAVLLAALLFGGCAHARRAPQEPRARVAVLPPENLAGVPVPMGDIRAALETSLARSGVEVVGGEVVQRYLQLHRIRYTGGISGPAALAAKEDLGVDGLLVTWVGEWSEGPPPAVAFSMRLVSASDPPVISWIDALAARGDDHPGIFGLGTVSSMGVQLTRTLDDLTKSLAAFLDGRAPRARRCDGDRGPRWAYQSPVFRLEVPASVVVLPFVNRTSRRGAGETVALEVGRQLAAIPGIEVLEPGMVREDLLRLRLIMQEGPSLDDVFALGALLQPDLVVSGQVLEYEERGEPRLSFSVAVMERKTRRLVWRSSSYARGNDGVWFFDAGRVSSPLGLACQMSRGVIERFVVQGAPSDGSPTAP
jgi:hypothetical protein